MKKMILQLYSTEIFEIPGMEMMLTGILTIGLLSGCAGQTENGESANVETKAGESANVETKASESTNGETGNGQVQAEPADYYLITNVYGDGQKPWAVVLEYSTDVAAPSVSVSDFSVDNYDIVNAYVTRLKKIVEPAYCIFFSDSV